VCVVYDAYVCVNVHICVCVCVCIRVLLMCLQDVYKCIICNFFLLLLLIKLAPIEISRSLTPSTGGGSTCTKVVLGGATSSPRPAAVIPAKALGQTVSHCAEVPSRHSPAVPVGLIGLFLWFRVYYHLGSGVPICLRDIVGIGRSQRKFNSI